LQQAKGEMIMPLFGPPNIEKLKDKGNVQGLIKALDYEKDLRIVEDAQQALIEIGAPTVDLLVEALQSDSESVRQRTAEALGAISDRRAVKPLCTALEREAGMQRFYIVQALGKIGDPEAVDALIAALEYEPVGIALAAIESLSKIGDDRAVQPLTVLLQDAPDQVKKAAEKALSQFDTALPSTPPAVEEAPIPPRSVSDVLFAIFRDQKLTTDPRNFAQQLITRLFPDRLGEGRIVVHFELDPEMPADIETAGVPSQESYGMDKVLSAMEEFGLGPLDLEKRHDVDWSAYTDELGGRGLVYVVTVWSD
jgi:hypothetical protein